MSMRQSREAKIQEWTAALRSGKYKQGKGWLYKDDKYCCLGVYADLNDIATEIGGNELAYLPALEWEKLDMPIKQSNLSALNDGREFTFNQIADVIEVLTDL